LTRLPWPWHFHLRLARRARARFLRNRRRPGERADLRRGWRTTSSLLPIARCSSRKTARSRPCASTSKTRSPSAGGCGSSAAARLAGIAAGLCISAICAGRTIGSSAKRRCASIIPTTHLPAGSGALTVARMANQVQAQVVEVKAEREVAAVAGGSRRSAVDRASPPRAALSYSRADAVTQHSEFHAGCSRRLRKTGPICFPRRSKTVSISPIARRFVHCFRRSRN